MKITHEIRSQYGEAADVVLQAVPAAAGEAAV
jgi:hypothetical protein